MPAYLEGGCGENLYHMHYPGGHGMAKERVDFIIDWIVQYKTIGDI